MFWFGVAVVCFVGPTIAKVLNNGRVIIRNIREDTKDGSDTAELIDHMSEAAKAADRLKKVR